MRAIVVPARTVTLAGGEDLSWDRLLLATGAEPRRLALPGTDLEGVVYLRSLPDSERYGPSRVRAAGWSSSEPAGSAPKPPPRRGRSAWR